MRGVNNSVDTVNAAATAIANAESRVQPEMVQKKRWGSCWSLYWCFGSHRHSKRIGHAVLVPEPTVPGTVAPAPENPSHHPPSIILPFVAPPSSPVSFLQSEPPSATQSPAGLLALTSLSSNVYSPRGPPSMFAIGPYAHETQLVSPPVFSTFTTEPSTASFTPPPEPVHLTTPSSPEVPFARLLTSSLDSNHRNREVCQKYPFSHYEFQSYQLYPGSPVGHLISPSSGISDSGTSSPFPDCEFTSGGRPFLEFCTGDPPKLLGIDELSTFRWRPPPSSGSLTPDAMRPTSQDSFLLESQISEVASLANSDNESQTENHHRVSFELNAKVITDCAEKDLMTSVEAVSEPLRDRTAEEVVAAATTERDGSTSESENNYECRVGETSNGIPEKAPTDGEEEVIRYQKHRSLTLGSVKEFNFDNTDGGSPDKPTVSSSWWAANEKVVGKEAGSCNNWAFFPMIQPGIS